MGCTQSQAAPATNTPDKVEPVVVSDKVKEINVPVVTQTEAPAKTTEGIKEEPEVVDEIPPSSGRKEETVDDSAAVESSVPSTKVVSTEEVLPTVPSTKKEEEAVPAAESVKAESEKPSEVVNEIPPNSDKKEAADSTVISEDAVPTSAHTSARVESEKKPVEE